jgi:hypothetical protein
MLTFETNASNSPLSLKMTVDPTAEGFQQPIDLKIGICPEKWLNQPLRQLAYYDSVKRVCESLRKGRSLILEISTEGNLVYGARMNEGTFALEADMEHMIAAFEDCRTLAERFGVAPTLPAKIQDLTRGLKMGVLISQLLNKRTIELLGRGMKVSGTMIGVGLDSNRTNNRSSPIEFVFPGRHFDLFSEKIFIGPLHCRLTQAKLGPCRSNPSEGTTDMSWIGGEDSICEFRLADSSP